MGELTQVYEVAVIGMGVFGLPLLAYIARSVQRVNIALFGLRGTNGLVGDVQVLKEWRTSHELDHADMGAN